MLLRNGFGQRCLKLSITIHLSFPQALITKHSRIILEEMFKCLFAILVSSVELILLMLVSKYEFGWWNSIVTSQVPVPQVGQTSEKLIVDRGRLLIFLAEQRKLL